MRLLIRVSIVSIITFDFVLFRRGDVTPIFLHFCGGYRRGFNTHFDRMFPRGVVVFPVNRNLFFLFGLSFLSGVSWRLIVVKSNYGLSRQL